MAGFPKAGDQYGRYRIVAEIGHGGMGVVYQAQDTVLNRPVALKIVLPSLADREEYHQRFALEAAALARIPSRHIVGIYDYGEHEDTVYFATQFFPDGDLQSWLTQHGPLDRRTALSLTAQVCEALADAHRAGVVHRDVKPGNVLLWSRPEGLVPYLADFGIAVEGEPAKRSGLTRTGTLIGSPAYMAPERHFGHPADERGDVYSAGCLMWAALTGDAPYSGTDFQMMNSHINAPVVAIGGGDPIDSRIDAVLAAALEKDPDRRIPSAAEMQRQLLEIVREIDASLAPVPAPAPVLASAADPGAESSDRTVIRPAAVPPPVAASAALTADPDRPSRRRRLLAPVLAAAVIVVASAVGAGVVLAQGDEPSADPTAPGTTTTVTSPTVDPPTAPAAPRVRAAPGYRSVVFTLAAPSDDDVSIEVNAGDGWTVLQGKTRRVVTEQGGDQACLRARAVSTQDGLSANSDVARTCGHAQPRTVAMSADTSRSCSVIANGGYEYDCWWYGLKLSGFKPHSTQRVRMHEVGKPDDCPTKSSCQEVQVDGSGRLQDPELIRVIEDLGIWVVTVDDTSIKVDLQGPYVP